MTARGVIFSGVMAKALVAGRKTATRRLASNANAARVTPGDLLWVRESFRLESGFDGVAPNVLLATAYERMPVWHEADRGAPDPQYARSAWGHPWGRLRPAIHMPRWASRLTLTVRAVGREPLTRITNDGAIAEGVERSVSNGCVLWRGAPAFPWRATPVEAYRDLWDGLNPDPSSRFDADPDIIIIEFSVSERNIADVLAQHDAAASNPGRAA